MRYSRWDGVDKKLLMMDAAEVILLACGIDYVISKSSAKVVIGCQG